MTTVAYRQATLGTAVEDGSATDAAAARSAVLRAAFPVPVADAIREAYARLGSGSMAVAVRSSATAEDLPGASFAGQQDTYLNIAGIGNVLDAVHRCWASLWTDRAVAYRAAQGIDGAGVALAVVVQRMVDAAVAGVLFTADPVTGRRRQAVIDAAPGLGEAVVSGSVDPDRFVVDTATARFWTGVMGEHRISACPMRRSSRWPDSATGSRHRSVRRRTSSGHSTGRDTPGSPSRARSPPSSLSRCAGRRCRQTRPGSSSASAWRRDCTGRSPRSASRHSG